MVTPPQETPTILVAGGAGYIGSHTCKQLLRHGFQPLVLDNLSTGNRFALRFGLYCQADISDKEVVRALIRQHRPTAAILFAGHAYVGESTENPRKYYRNNISASLNFLDSLIEEGVKKIVFSSSCSIYGQQSGAPISEDSPKDPLSPYAETKWFFERILDWCGKADSLQHVNLRYFNAAGADPEGDLGEYHRPETHLIPLALAAADGGAPLRVFGTDYPTPDGTAIRDYIHVLDLAAAHVRAVQHLISEGSSVSLNLGTGKGSSVREVIACVEKTTGNQVQVRYEPRRSGDAASLIADPRKAAEVLGWLPSYSSLENIIETAWRWHSKIRSEGESALLAQNAGALVSEPQR